MPSKIANTPTGIRKLNTKVFHAGDSFTVTLYDTMVYNEDATSITLNNGGWITPTTISRINQALTHRGHDVRVFIKNREMFWQSTCGNPQPFLNGVAVIRKSEVA